jgi:hypothetical protein
MALGIADVKAHPGEPALRGDLEIGGQARDRRVPDAALRAGQVDEEGAMRQAPCRAAAQALDERRPIGGIGNAVVAESAGIAHHGLKSVDLLRGKDRRDRGEGRFDG